MLEAARCRRLSSCRRPVRGWAAARPPGKQKPLPAWASPLLCSAFLIARNDYGCMSLPPTATSHFTKFGPFCATRPAAGQPASSPGLRWRGKPTQAPPCHQRPSCTQSQILLCRRDVAHLHVAARRDNDTSKWVCCNALYNRRRSHYTSIGRGSAPVDDEQAKYEKYCCILVQSFRCRTPPPPSPPPSPPPAF